MWRDTYNFRPSEISTPEARDFISRFIKTAGDVREGWTLDNVDHDDTWMEVGFLNSIFHPNRPKQVTMKWASTFIGAINGWISVDWRAFMKTKIDREVEKRKRLKKPPTCLPTFPIHLYRNNNLLTPKEIAEYDKLKSLQKYVEAEPEVFEDLEDVQEVSPTPKKSRTNSEVGQPSGTPQSSTPAKRTLVTEALKPIGPPEYTGDPCVDLAHLAGQMTHYINYLQELTKHEHRVVQEVNAITETSQVDECLAKLWSFREIRDWNNGYEEQLGHLRERVNKLQQELHDARVDFREARDWAAAADVQSLVEIKDTRALPIDVANQCAVYQQFLMRQPDPIQKAIILFICERTQMMEATLTKMKEFVASLELGRIGPIALDVPSENQETQEIPDEPAPDVAPAKVPSAQSPIWSAIRPPTLLE